MKMQIVGYKAVSAKSAELLTELVNDEIDKGLVPFGGISVTEETPDQYGCFAQALVRYYYEE